MENLAINGQTCLNRFQNTKTNSLQNDENHCMTTIDGTPTWFFIQINLCVLSFNLTILLCYAGLVSIWAESRGYHRGQWFCAALLSIYPGAMLCFLASLPNRNICRRREKILVEINARISNKSPQAAMDVRNLRHTSPEDTLGDQPTTD